MPSSGCNCNLPCRALSTLTLAPGPLGCFQRSKFSALPTRSVQCFLSGDCDRAFPMLSGDPSRDMLFCCAWALVPDITCFTLHRNSSASRPRRTRLRSLGFLSVTLATFRRHHTSLLLSSALSVPVSSCVCQASTTLVVSFVLVSGPFFVVTLCVTSRVPASAGVESCVPEDHDPPCGTGVRCSVFLFGIKCDFLSRLRLRMAHSTRGFQYFSTSWVSARMWFQCLGQRAVDPLVSCCQSCSSRWGASQQLHNPISAPFTVSLLSALSTS